MSNIDLSKIKTNTIVRCLHCGSLVQSLHRHDFKYCSCRSIAVDGGADYLRIIHELNSQYIVVKDEEDLNTPLVGPRDTSMDRTWCEKCGQFVLKHKTERRTIKKDIFGEKHEVERDFCLPECK